MRLRVSALFGAALLTAACNREEDAVPTRPFYMAVTPWPADFTLPAVDSAYSFINSHCNAVSHHFDDGVPYEEVYRNLILPASLQNDVAQRKSKTAGGKTVFLSVAPLNLTRREKAAYYREALTADSTKQRWAAYPINHPAVVAAYAAYVNYLIGAFRPAFVNYGVESNEVSWPPNRFAEYNDFLRQVYARLKAMHPGLPLFVSFMVTDDPLSLQRASQLLPYTDHLALSAYPYVTALSTADGITDPSRFPTDYFTRFLNLAPNKPWGFAETGYIAEDLSVPTYGLDKKGTAAWQDAYLKLVLQLGTDRKAEYLVWFCHRDYDAGNNRLRTLGLYQDVFALWEDTGLTDEAGRTRAAYHRWLEWVKRERTD